MFLPNKFLQIAEHVSPNLQRFHRTSFSKLLTTFPQMSNVLHRTGFSKSPNTFLQISKMFRRSEGSTRSVLFSMEKTPSLISPYMCYGLHALRYRWLAMVLWSRLFLLHMHGLRARCYGLWASQGQELSKELTARTPLILHLS